MGLEWMTERPADDDDDDDALCIYIPLQANTTVLRRGGRRSAFAGRPCRLYVYTDGVKEYLYVVMEG